MLSLRIGKGGRVELDFSRMTDLQFTSLRHDSCKVVVVEVCKGEGQKGTALLSFDFPKAVKIVRGELLERGGCK